MFRVQIRTFEHTLCVCVHVCVCVYQNTSGCGTAQLASAGLKPRCWSMCKNGSQQDAHEKKVKVFLTALFKKGNSDPTPACQTSSDAHNIQTHISV